MEEIHTHTQIKTIAARRVLFVCFIVLGVALLLAVRLHAESFDFGKYRDDEYHTIFEGINLIVSGRVENFRAQESTRWLVRAFYPYSLIYMNSNMGGNIYRDGWQYPGHDYVINNFINKKDEQNAFSRDPNLRDLIHALRQQYIFFVFACVMALIYFFFRRQYYVATIGSLLLLGLNLDLLGEQKIFYIEPGVLASLSIFILAYLCLIHRGSITGKTAILLGFLAAFIVSTKFSAVMFIFLPFALFFYHQDRRQTLRLSIIYLAGTFGFYILINFPAFTSIEGLNLFLHDFFSNFWQYSAGSSPDITVSPGIPHLGLMVFQLEGLFGYALYLLPIIILFAIWRASAKDRMILIPLAILTAMSVGSLAKQHVYLVRNLLPFYVPMVVVSMLSIEIVASRFAATYGARYMYGFIGIISAMFISGIVIHAGGPDAFRSRLFPNTRQAIISELRAIERQSSPDKLFYAIGFSKSFFRGTGLEEKIETMNDVLSDINNESYPELLSRFDSLPKDSVVLVNRVLNNKHLTNYVLPEYFNNNIQFGAYYMFNNKD